MTFYQRNLPHWHPPGQDIFITWRLKGSLPKHLRSVASKELSGKRFVELDRALDRGDCGPLWLRDPRVAECLVATLRTAMDKTALSLHAYAVMANHVHILITPITSVADITKRIKGGSACQANRLLGFTGSTFWQDESFDHWVSDPAEWQKIRTYIEHNPVAARLVARPEDWPWSSASRPLK
jgi:REP-associated tyrosine transposase